VTRCLPLSTGYLDTRFKFEYFSNLGAFLCAPQILLVLPTSKLRALPLGMNIAAILVCAGDILVQRSSTEGNFVRNG